MVYFVIICILLVIATKILKWYNNRHSSEETSQEELSVILAAADKGDPNAITCVACMYDEGLCGFSKDIDKAFDLFMIAAEGGNPLAMNNLGEYYLNENKFQDVNKAFEWFHKAALKGVDTACVSLGMMYLNGRGVEKDYKMAAWWYVKAANMGNSQAMDVINTFPEMPFKWAVKQIYDGQWKPKKE